MCIMSSHWFFLTTFPPIHHRLSSRETLLTLSLLQWWQRSRGRSDLPGLVVWCEWIPVLMAACLYWYWWLYQWSNSVNRVRERSSCKGRQVWTVSNCLSVRGSPSPLGVLLEMGVWCSGKEVIWADVTLSDNQLNSGSASDIGAGLQCWMIN